MTWKRWGLLGGLILIFLAGHHCGRDLRKSDGNNPPAEPVRVALAPDETQKIVFNKVRDRFTIVTRKDVGEVSVKEVVGIRHATVVVKKDGTVQITARSFGLCLEPGLGLAFGDGPGLILDLQFGYWRDAGAFVGARVYPHPTGYLALGYSLSAIHMSNTSVFLGVGLGREILGGVRVAF